MDDAVARFWQAFRLRNPEKLIPAEPDDIFAFGDTPDMADRLGARVVQGLKTATTSALWAYRPDETVPAVGHLSIVLDGGEKPLCVIETTDVRQLPFAEVDAAFARDEGEGDRSLAYWREAHERFFSKTLPQVGKTFAKDMPVLCERFRVVWLEPS